MRLALSNMLTMAGWLTILAAVAAAHYGRFELAPLLTAAGLVAILLAPGEKT